MLCLFHGNNHVGSGLRAEAESCNCMIEQRSSYPKKIPLLFLRMLQQRTFLTACPCTC